MEHRNHRKNRKRQRPQSVAKPSAEIVDITSMEDFRTKYLPRDEKELATHRMTPGEIGEEIARQSLTVARQALIE
jgi:hypothetical protein